tara:strand:+ start:526 stop:1599 length:1074 start_codon:yes stop_codon:yes gene_type:complete
MKVHYTVPLYKIDELEQILDSQSKINQTHTLNFIDYLAYSIDLNDKQLIHIAIASLIKNQSQRWYLNELPKLRDSGIIIVDDNYIVGATTKSYTLNDTAGYSLIEIDANEKSYIKTFKNDHTISNTSIDIHKKFISNLVMPKININKIVTLKDALNTKNLLRMKHQTYNVIVTRHRLYSPFVLLSKSVKQSFNLIEVDITSCQPQMLPVFFDETIPLDEKERYLTALKQDIYTSLITNEDRDKLKVDMMKIFNSKKSTSVIKTEYGFEYQPLYYKFKEQFPNILQLIRNIKKTECMYDKFVSVEKTAIQDTIETLYKLDIIVGSNHDAIYCEQQHKSIVIETLTNKLKDLGTLGLVK